MNRTSPISSSFAAKVSRCHAATVAIVFSVLCTVVSAGQPASGWRGDGTGKYPDAEPPVEWGRISNVMKGLRAQAAKPASAEPAGKPIPDGALREWLVLGPVAIPDEPKALEKDTLPGEAQLEPSAGDKTGELTWKAVALDHTLFDFNTIIGKHDKSFAYACTHVYSETGGTYRANFTTSGNVRVIVNGKPAKAMGIRSQLQFVKGWNRLLVKVTSTPSAEVKGERTWYLQAVLHGMPPVQYEDTNIAWYRPLPGAAAGFYGGGSGNGAAVVCGEKLFVPVEPYDLYCLNKADGKILWVRSNGYFTALPPDEIKGNPALAAIQPLQDQSDKLTASITGDKVDPKLLDSHAKLEQEVANKLKGVDGQRFTADRPDIGFAGYVPVTDGQRVCVWCASGVTACYDLEGNRQWIRIDKRAGVEHGFSSSPTLADGRVVVFMRDLMAFDMKTGAPAWTLRVADPEGVNPGGFLHSSTVAFKLGGKELLALGDGSIVNPSNGQFAVKKCKIGAQSVASPVVDGQTFLHITSGSSTLYIHSLPLAFADSMQLTTRDLPVNTTGFPYYYLPWHLSSPLLHEGLAYVVNNTGVLTVVDVKEAKVLYQRVLDLDQFQWVNEAAFRGVGISPTLAGKQIYFFGDAGGALIIAPGREYKQIAKNKIENAVLVGHWAERQERFVANPVFDGKRLYLRSEAGLYAIGR
ncbi:MAG TPA: PQQ-binding-like beta-propeller repeat protein [Planctomycetota bacterium]